LLGDFIANIAKSDPHRRRFGASKHDYRMRPPLPLTRLEAIERELDVRFPDDYREYVQIADGGAGPYYGLMPLDHPVQLACARGTFDPDAAGRALYDGTVGLAHLGCGYIAFLVVRGDDAGTVFVDVRAAGDGVKPVFDRFFLDGFVGAWVRSAALQEMPPSYVTPGHCALPAALTSYLHAVEDRLGLAHDTLPPEEIARALADIPDGGVATAETGDTPFFAAGDLVDPCAICAQTAANLGLRPAQMKPGLSPIPLRVSPGG
jgi:hypothetical protein